MDSDGGNWLIMMVLIWIGYSASRVADELKRRNDAELKEDTIDG